MGEIIALGRRAKATLPTPTDARIAAALAVHDLIVTLIHARQGELKDVAEGLFERVHGDDPYVFAARLVNARRA